MAYLSQNLQKQRYTIISAVVNDLMVALNGTNF